MTSLTFGGMTSEDSDVTSDVTSPLFARSVIAVFVLAGESASLHRSTRLPSLACLTEGGKG